MNKLFPLTILLCLASLSFSQRGDVLTTVDSAAVLDDPLSPAEIKETIETTPLPEHPTDITHAFTSARPANVQVSTEGDWSDIDTTDSDPIDYTPAVVEEWSAEPDNSNTVDDGSAVDISDEWSTETDDFFPNEEYIVDDAAISEEWNTEAEDFVSNQEFGVDSPDISEEWNTEADDFFPNEEFGVDNPLISEEWEFEPEEEEEEDVKIVDDIDLSEDAEEDAIDRVPEYEAVVGKANDTEEEDVTDIVPEYEAVVGKANDTEEEDVMDRVPEYEAVVGDGNDAEESPDTEGELITEQVGKDL